MPLMLNGAHLVSFYFLHAHCIGEKIFYGVTIHGFFTAFVREGRIRGETFDSLSVEVEIFGQVLDQ